MAGCFAIIAAARNSYWIERFKQSGSMAEYVFLYRYTIVALIMTYIGGLIVLANPKYLALCFSFLMADLGYVSLVIWQGHSIKAKADSPPEE